MDPQPKSMLLPVLLAFLGAGVVFGTAGYYIATSQQSEINPDLYTFKHAASPKPKATVTAITTPTPVATPSTSSSTTDTSNWRMYTSSELGVSFKYPPELGDVKEQKEDYSADPTPAAKGKEIRLSFSKNKNLDAWAVTKSFEASRGYSLGEITTFSVTDNKCKVLAGTIDCEAVRNADKENAYIGITTNSEGDELYLAGYIPLRKPSEYVALTFRDNRTDSTSKEALKKILSTFQLTK